MPHSPCPPDEEVGIPPQKSAGQAALLHVLYALSPEPYALSPMP